MVEQVLLMRGNPVEAHAPEISIAAPSPTAPAMFGVPASKRYGRSL
jgi:hypothetical protein